MIIAVLVVLGLAWGSFVNALVWRLHEQATAKRQDRELSVMKGRSMCPHCRHGLAVGDLVPVFSWLFLRGKCRYCGQPVSMQYPAVELGTAFLFAASYVWWPQALHGSQLLLFIIWLALLVGFMALLVYDLRWMLLPNRLVYPVGCLAGLWALVSIATAARPLTALFNLVLAVAVGGGIFYLLFQLSAGKWIGGGDVRLGWLLGLVVGTPARALLFILLASLLGTAVSLPLLAARRLKKNSVIPFGPFLIIGTVLVVLFGHDVLQWYQRTFLPFST